METTTTATAKCTHTWERTGIGFVVSGRKWQQGRSVSYCPKCRQFSTKTTMFLDGDMFKTDALAAQANEEEWYRCKTERDAWQREHYPDHITTE